MDKAGNINIKAVANGYVITTEYSMNGEFAWVATSFDEIVFILGQLIKDNEQEEETI